MKNLRTYSLCVCLMLAGLVASAQTPEVRTGELNAGKPKLFNALPENIPVDISMITSLINDEVGKSVNVGLNTSIRLQGQVVSTSDRSDQNIQSSVIRLVNYPGARLTITSSKDADGNITYVGRIISKEHSDVYELKNLNGQYTFIKKNYHDLINE